MAKKPADMIEVGRLFHKRGPATAKDRSRRQSLTEAQTGDRNLLTAGVGWQLQTMVAGCSPQGNRPSCRGPLIRHGGHLKRYRHSIESHLFCSLTLQY